MAYICTICLENFTIGITKPGFEVCFDCLKTSIKTNKRVNLYASGGNFPLGCYIKSLYKTNNLALKAKIAKLYKIITEESGRLAFLDLSQFSNDLIKEFNLSVPKINAYVLLYKLKNQSSIINYSKTKIKNDEKIYQLFKTRFDEALNEFNNYCATYEIAKLINIIKSLFQDFGGIITEDVFYKLCLDHDINYEESRDYYDSIKLISVYFNDKLEKGEIDTYKKNQGRCDYCSSGVYFNYVCNSCQSIKCKKCGVTYKHTYSHTCSEEDIKRYTEDKYKFKFCPSCYVPVERVQGCPDMWCKNCHKMFNWDTLKLIHQSRHNPDKMEYMNTRHEEENLIVTPDLFKTFLNETLYYSTDVYKDMLTFIKYIFESINKQWCGGLILHRDLKASPEIYAENLNVINYLNNIYQLFDLPLFIENIYPTTSEMFSIGNDLLNEIMPVGMVLIQHARDKNLEEMYSSYTEIVQIIDRKNKSLSIPLDYASPNKFCSSMKMMFGYTA